MKKGESSAKIQISWRATAEERPQIVYKGNSQFKEEGPLVLIAQNCNKKWSLKTVIGVALPNQSTPETQQQLKPAVFLPSVALSWVLQRKANSSERSQSTGMSTRFRHLLTP